MRLGAPVASRGKRSAGTGGAPAEIVLGGLQRCAWPEERPASDSKQAAGCAAA